MEDRHITIEDIKKVRHRRHHEIKKSYGICDAFLYAKNKNLIEKGVTRKIYSSIIKEVGSIARGLMIDRKEFILPYCILPLVVIYKPITKKIKDGKLRTNLVVNWGATLKLWVSDEDSRKNKILIRSERREGYYVYALKKRGKCIKNRSYLFFFKNRM